MTTQCTSTGKYRRYFLCSVMIFIGVPSYWEPNLWGVITRKWFDSTGRASHHNYVILNSMRLHGMATTLNTQN
jgi:hypothetical protein